MRTIQYGEFGAVLVRLRKGSGWNQREFAVRAQVTQQTVSRWEAGYSRPRSKDLADLAALLHADLAELEIVAGYTSSRTNVELMPTGAPTLDVVLPLSALRPDSFENFCSDFLTRYYRERGGVANRFGGTGSKQHGIDIEVRGSFGVHTFQCKRVEEFGEQKVHTAVAAHQYPSNLKVLLLSNIASPKARIAITHHESWQLWDSVDISAKFRELPKVDRKDLVDIYFRGQRQALLGEPEPGPFQSTEEFFKPFMQRDRYFSHSWALVGREEEVANLSRSVLDSNTLVTLLLGAPGNGKTRVLREVVDQLKNGRPNLAVWFVSPTEDVKAQHLDELGGGAKLLVVDDAHDRDDIGQLLRYAATPDNNAQLLLALRPYGKAMIRSQAARMSMDSPQVSEVELRPRTRDDAKVLALEVLKACGGALSTAESIAELTYQTPLVTVLAAQIVSKEDLHPALISNSEAFKEHVLAMLEKIIAGEIVKGQDIPKIQGVLRIVALLQPIAFDDPGLLKILRVVEGLEAEDALRLLRLLSDGGVLFKRGLRYRLAPDLLADSIIQRNFISPSGGITQKVEDVFELADTGYLKHLLVNLGRLDWRLHFGAAERSTLLDTLTVKLKWLGRYNNPHIEAVVAVAYYQPRLALDFATRLIEEGHGEILGVCQMVRNASFNLEYLEEACVLLWRAGKNDTRALHQHPSHGIRILKEMAEFAPNQPVECVERVVAFALDLLKRPVSLRGVYTPFNILEGALRTEMEEVTSSRHTITIKRYKLNFELAKSVRARVIDAIVDAIGSNEPRKGFLAACALAEALRSPPHIDDAHVWNIAHADLLTRIRNALAPPLTNPIVLMRAAMCVSWHAFYNNDPACSSLAKSIIELLERDLPVRLVRVIVDAWGTGTWRHDESFEQKAYNTEMTQLISDLVVAYPEATNLYNFLAHWLRQIDEIAPRGLGHPQIFITRLFQTRPDLAQEVLSRVSSGDLHLSAFAGSALAVLIEGMDRQMLLSDLLESTASHNEAWKLVSEAYARQENNFLSDEDIPLLRKIFQSDVPAVLLNAATIVRQVARRNPTLAIELICSADLSVSLQATRDFLMWLTHSDSIPAELIRPEQWCILLQGLTHLQDIDDYWIWEFLKQAIQTVPAEVIHLMKRRLLLDGSSFSYTSNRGETEDCGLFLLTHPNGQKLLSEFLSWAVEHYAGSDTRVDVGSCVSILCGSYGAEIQKLLLDFVEGGSQAHVDVADSILRCAPQNFLIESTPFIRELLNQAELISDQAVKDFTSSLFSAALSGGRSGTVGEPFKEDLILEAHAEQVLNGMSKVDPAFELYAMLLTYAKESIARQHRQKQAMEDD